MDGRATKTSSTFRMACAVDVRIAAPPKVVWGLLTNAGEFPTWNSTVESIEGPIERGAKLALRVSMARDRVFRPRVTVFEPETRMVWSDGFSPMLKGERTFALKAKERDSTHFSMVEVFSGLMLPMIKGSLPDFGPAFEQYAADLKREAEHRS